MIGKEISIDTEELNLEKVLQQINKKVKITWKELFILFDNKVKIIYPNKAEKRFNWFSEQEIEEFLLNTLKIQDKEKHKIFLSVVNWIDFSKLSKEEFKAFLSWGYKKYLIQEIANKLIEKVSVNLTGQVKDSIIFSCEAGAKFILREKFKLTNLKLASYLKDFITKADYKIINTLLWARLKDKLFKDPSDFFSNTIGEFYKQMKNKCNIFHKEELIVYQEHLIPHIKTFFTEKIKKNLDIVDDALLEGLVNSFFKKNDVLKTYLILSELFLWDLKLNNWFVKKYLLNVFSGEIIILKNRRYKLPVLNLTDFRWEKISILLPKLTQFLSHYDLIKKDYFWKKTLLEIKKEEKTKLESELNKILYEKYNTKTNFNKCKQKLAKIRKSIRDINGWNINFKNFKDSLKQAVSAPNKLSILRKERDELVKLATNYSEKYRNIINKELKIKAELKELNIEHLEKSVNDLEIEYKKVEKKYKKLLLEFSQNLMKKKTLVS